MKITFPECQIEISPEELLVLIKHFNLFDAGTQLVQEIEVFKEHLPLELSHINCDSDQVLESESEPEPKQKSTRLKKPKKAMAPTDNEPVEKPKKKSSGNSKSVQVLFENGWKTFKSVSQAAEAIGTRLNHLSHALLNGKTCNGHQVRYANNKEQSETTNEEPTELPQ